MGEERKVLSKKKKKNAQKAFVYHSVTADFTIIILLETLGHLKLFLPKANVSTSQD